jgi:glutathione peroxidase-family protein
MSRIKVSGGRSYPKGAGSLVDKHSLISVLLLQWNFEKFLIDQDGKVVNRWASTTTPQAIDASVAKLLANCPKPEPTTTATAPEPTTAEAPQEQSSNL